MSNVGRSQAGNTLIGQGVTNGPRFAALGTDSGLTANGVVIAHGTSPFTATPAGTTGQVLMGNTGSAPSFQSLNATSKITQYDNDGSWTIDPLSVKVDFYAWGGGGGGGSGRCGVSNSSTHGGAGGGTSFLFISYAASVLTGSPYVVTIGTGGTGAASANGVVLNGNPGNPGTATSVGNIVVCGGGLGGEGGQAGGGAGGIGRAINNGVQVALGSGASSASISTPTAALSIIYGAATGGGSGAAQTTGTPRVGGQGGSLTDGVGTVLVAGGLGGANTGGTGGNGNSPSNQIITLGGTGGGGGGNDGGAVTPVAGTGGNGAAPGGGGGGGGGTLSSNPSGAGGNGAEGRVIIVEYF